MPFTQETKEKISIQIIKVLYSRFESFPEDATGNRNAPFHKAFLNAFSDKFHGKVSDTPFFITLSSWLHGLNTTLGQIFFENVAHILCNGEKREHTSKKEGNLPIDMKQRIAISKIVANLSTGVNKPNLEEENKAIYLSDKTEETNAIDFSADVYIDDNEKITAIELKSVRPNSGEMKGEKNKILEGKAALYRKHPDKEIKFFIGFPFDPTNSPDEETGSDKKRFLGSIINMEKFFAEDEVLLAEELWNFLSGEKNTMQQILDLINTIATIDFIERYNFVKDKSNREVDFNRYKSILNEWNLTSELELISRDSEIKEKTKTDKRLATSYNQLIFKKGCYNTERYLKLKVLLT